MEIPLAVTARGGPCSAQNDRRPVVGTLYFEKNVRRRPRLEGATPVAP